jgi:hypothetical protein
MPQAPPPLSNTKQTNAGRRNAAAKSAAAAAASGLASNGSRHSNGNGNANNRYLNFLPSKPSSSPRLPLSGSEDLYTDLVYGSPRGTSQNNCWAYAIDEYRNAGDTKLQPGNLSRHGGELQLVGCGSLRGRAARDLHGRAYPEKPERPCRPGFYKIMAFLAPGRDYHWYKQHKDALITMPPRFRDLPSVARALGVRPSQLVSPSPAPRQGDLVLVKGAGVWSHKQGFATGPLLRDACDRVITDPRTACRNYGGEMHYKQYCGSWCVKSKKGKK